MHNFKYLASKLYEHKAVNKRLEYETTDDARLLLIKTAKENNLNFYISSLALARITEIGVKHLETEEQHTVFVDNARITDEQYPIEMNRCLALVLSAYFGLVELERFDFECLINTNNIKA